jgi:hypothetical protein
LIVLLETGLHHSEEKGDGCAPAQGQNCREKNSVNFLPKSILKETNKKEIHKELFHETPKTYPLSVSSKK